ncbi:hypothetical protein JCM18904_1891 [Vibrio sp. JCM 18904]|nr:hypothetical protein JCM18904_1891 [Vibrio sp. JCM 18904]
MLTSIFHHSNTLAQSTNTNSGICFSNGATFEVILFSNGVWSRSLLLKTSGTR